MSFFFWSISRIDNPDIWGPAFDSKSNVRVILNGRIALKNEEWEASKSKFSRAFQAWICLVIVIAAADGIVVPAVVAASVPIYAVAVAAAAAICANVPHPPGITSATASSIATPTFPIGSVIG